MSARAPAEYCARDESAAARIIEVEQSAYHLACRIEPRDIASTDILHIGVGRNLDAAESEGHAAGDGISLERRLVDRIRPIRFWIKAVLTASRAGTSQVRQLLKTSKGMFEENAVYVYKSKSDVILILFKSISSPTLIISNS